MHTWAPRGHSEPVWLVFLLAKCVCLEAPVVGPQTHSGAGALGRQPAVRGRGSAQISKLWQLLPSARAASRRPQVGQACSRACREISVPLTGWWGQRRESRRPDPWPLASRLRAEEQGCEW